MKGLYMFHEIDPQKFTYDPDRKSPEAHDAVIFSKDRSILLGSGEGELAIPRYSDAQGLLQGKPGGFIYLFSLGETAYFLSLEQVGETRSYQYRNVYSVRNAQPSQQAFVCATAFHLAHWYANNRYCGQCAGPFEHKENERALSCPRCGVVKYPRISPVIIVGIIDGENLLLTKYAGREYTNHALVSGFVEPGEALEGAIAREVMEEVGLEVTNVRYYKSQPWAFSQSILMGFFADLSGGRNVTLDTKELSEAVWFPRPEIPVEESRLSLTWDMIAAFRTGAV